jgi:hypothetical protein
MARTIRWALGIFLVAVAAASCNTFTTQEATDRCNQEKAARAAGACFDSSTTVSCISAYEVCGADTIVNTTACPLTYSCPK